MKSHPHDSAHLHVAGRSEFVDDRPVRADEVFLDLYLSPHACATIASLDTSEALKTPGVLAVFTARDFADNIWGAIFKEQPLLAEDSVNFVGEPIAIIVGETRQAAALGRERIVGRFTARQPILSIAEAIVAKAFIGTQRQIACGDVDAAFKRGDDEIQGSITIHGAEHFYLENQASIAYPLEDGQIEIHTSSQHPSEVQHVAASALGLKLHDVVCVVKRMGGAFGGKETQAAPFAAYTALVAHRLKRAARLVLNKDDDMVITGKRNPFASRYRAAFRQDGLITALDVQLFSDGGAYADLSTAIMERAMLHCDNAYHIANCRIVGQVCRTNYHPHTAFRGFGGPKGVATIEKIIEEIAHRLKIDSLDVRLRNCYRAEAGRDTTPYGQKVENNCLPALFAAAESEADYRGRRSEIATRNAAALAEGSATISGLSLTAVKFGISFTTRFLNQANAMVIVHRDGTIQVATGATEMGQGVNVRIAQIVADEFGIGIDQVRVMPTRTDKNANTSPTAASSGTDLNGAAALLAARRIKARLSDLACQLFALPRERWPRKTAGLGSEPELGVTERCDTEDANLGADWGSGVATFHAVEFVDGRVFFQDNRDQSITLHELVEEAYHSRISLADYGYYRIPNLTFNKVDGSGRAFLYFSQGVAASEVEINTDTGDVKVRRVDLIMDLGRPINADQDMGQVTGGFIQGMGWVTTEKLFYEQGALLTRSPSTYKIPNIQDTPREFNVRLLDNDANFANMKGTKASGEPPLFLAISVWTAVQDALRHLPEYGTDYPHIELPATNEEIVRCAHAGEYSRWGLLS